MKMTPGRRALDKIFKRRDRYEIPEWQRGEVWNVERKQQLVDSILRGWKLPKFYFLKVSEDQYEVVDGQQRLSAIYDFFSNDLSLSVDTIKDFGGPLYKDLKTKNADIFDDFEIEFDEIETATEEEIKQFFQRLQQGLPLSSSEKLNSIHSKLRDFCRSLTKHQFFAISVELSDTRLAYFDVTTKTLAIEIEGIDTSLRFEDVKSIFEANSKFSATAQVAKRVKIALDFLVSSFPQQEPLLKNRTIIQSLLTLTCLLVTTKKYAGLEKTFYNFVHWFLHQLGNQIELGQKATDSDFIKFQKSINANVKSGARTRHEVLLRKSLLYSSELAEAFGSNAIATSGLASTITETAETLGKQIHQINSAYSAIHGDDLFKSTNRTTNALMRLKTPASDLDSYTRLIEDLYFIFRESIGQRLATLPVSFVDVNTLRTERQHDVDHGNATAVRSKRKKAGATFAKYSGAKTPEILDDNFFPLTQAKLLAALSADLAGVAIPPLSSKNGGS
jgi:hypothetical protein